MTQWGRERVRKITVWYCWHDWRRDVKCVCYEILFQKRRRRTRFCCSIQLLFFQGNLIITIHSHFITWNQSIEDWDSIPFHYEKQGQWWWLRNKNIIIIIIVCSNTCRSMNDDNEFVSFHSPLLLLWREKKKKKEKKSNTGKVDDASEWKKERGREKVTTK